MMGWRARLGFLVPPGNPTTEPEMMQLAPPGVSVHFTRMVAAGAAGEHAGQEERNRSQIAHLDENVDLLQMVKPKVIVLAHTATSYTLGQQGEQALLERMRSRGVTMLTAFGSVVAALRHLGVSRIAYATPYNEYWTLRGVEHLKQHGLDVVAHGRLPGVRNIYEESAERAYQLGRQVDVAAADAMFLSGVGLPTIDAIDMLERDLGKPVVSSASAMMWNALRAAGIGDSIAGAGRLLRG
jgi:maleate isomerase